MHLDAGQAEPLGASAAFSRCRRCTWRVQKPAIERHAHRNRTTALNRPSRPLQLVASRLQQLAGGGQVLTRLELPREQTTVQRWLVCVCGLVTLREPRLPARAVSSRRSAACVQVQGGCGNAGRLAPSSIFCPWPCGSARENVSPKQAFEPPHSIHHNLCSTGLWRDVPMSHMSQHQLALSSRTWVRGRFHI